MMFNSTVLSESLNIIMCDDFNIHVYTTDSVKFLNCLETCNITQHVHTPLMHLHGHILDLILTPTKLSVVFNVWVCVCISGHALVHGQLDFISPSARKSNIDTFQWYHKIKMQSLRCDLDCCLFVTSLDSTPSALYEQYTKDLSGLLDTFLWSPELLPKVLLFGF